MNGQPFNRYSYCLNNPLVYSDPSGYYSDYSSGGGGNGGYYINDIPVSQFIFNAWFNFNLLNPDFRFEGYGSVISQYTEILNEARSFYRNYEIMQRFLSNPFMAEKYYEYMNRTNGHAKLEPGNSFDEYLPKNNSNENYYPSYNPSLFYVHGNDDPPNNQGELNINNYTNTRLARRDVTNINKKFTFNGTQISASESIWGAGDAITISKEIMPYKIIPWVGAGIEIYDAVNEAKKGQYVNAMWTLIEGAGGMYSVGIKSLYQLSQTEYFQLGMGQDFYEDYLYNINEYKTTGNQLFLKRAAKDEELMLKTYFNLKNKK